MACCGIRSLVLALTALFLHAPVHANQYKILVTQGSFSDAKRLGNRQQPWDVGSGKPDAYVVVSFNEQPVYVSGVNKDATRARWFTGTEYWKLPMTTRVTITVRDADAAKMVAGVGICGVAVRPDIPTIGKRVINTALAKVDTDDPIAVWSGTLGQLLQACGRRETDLLQSALAKQQFKSNAGLTSLHVRVVERPLDFEITAPRDKQYLGLSEATIERVKRRTKQPWDVGIRAAAQPDPRYVVFVNGSPVLAGGVNRDTVLATWGGSSLPLDLRADDTIAVALFDADAGSQLSTLGKAAVVYSPSLSKDAKQRVFETLNKMSTDDLVFLWVGDWATLARLPVLPKVGNDKHVWWNNGLRRVRVTTRAPAPRAAGAVVRLVVRSATIRTAKADGKAWDSSKGKPDPLVRCSVLREGGGWRTIGTSKPVNNSLQPVWNLAVSDKRLTAGARVKFDLFDKDALSNDLIATIAVTLPGKAGTYTARGGGARALVYEVAVSAR